MPRADKGDLIGGLIVCAIGAFFFIGAFEYDLGTMRRMGPGFLPMALGVITVLLGLLIAGLAIGRSGTVEWPRLRESAAILVSVAAFVLLFERVGMIPTVFVTVVVARLGDRSAKLLPTLALAAVVAIASWVVFALGLSLPMRAFRMPL